MGQDSKIEWCHHTANLWWGCQEVHAGCDHCYARTFDKRVGGDHWGARATRRPIRDVYANLLKWQKTAAAAGEVHRVFVGSMMDIFETSHQLEEPVTPMFHSKGAAHTTGELRDHFLWQFVPNCPNLLFLLLTKRPGNILGMIPDYWKEHPPSNVMYGCSVVNQETADRDIPKLLRVPGRHFLSVEPMIGPVILDELSVGRRCPMCNEWYGKTSDPRMCPDCDAKLQDEVPPIKTGIHWVICGGESGPGARPMHPQWARDVRDQCVAAGVPFLFKQWGNWLPVSQAADGEQDEFYHPAPVRDPEAIKKCKYDTAVMQLDGSIRNDFPVGAMLMYNVGKHKAGRLLDGRTWDEYPTPEEAPTHAE